MQSLIDECRERISKPRTVSPAAALPVPTQRRRGVRGRPRGRKTAQAGRGGLGGSHGALTSAASSIPNVSITGDSFALLLFCSQRNVLVSVEDKLGADSAEANHRNDDALDDDKDSVDNFNLARDVVSDSEDEQSSNASPAAFEASVGNNVKVRENTSSPRSLRLMNCNENFRNFCWAS